MGTGATGREILEKKLEKRLQDPKTEPLISLPLDFLEDITRGFSAERELGRGGCGVVYKGVLRSGKAIAVKKILDTHLLANNNQVEKEIIYLTEVRHQNVVQLVGYCVQTNLEVMEHSGKLVMAEKRACLLCFDFFRKGSLDKHLSDDTLGLDWDKRYKIIRGVCRGLHYLHFKRRIVHRDLKPQNILMDDMMMPKIGDFDLSRLLGQEKSRTVTANFAGTPGYMAPECIEQQFISFEADIFSLGVIIIEIITGRRDYPSIGERTETSLKHYTDKVVGSWKNRTPMHMSLEMHIQQVENCVSIALLCLEPESKKRPTSLDMVHGLDALEPESGSPGNSPIDPDEGLSKEDADQWEFANEGFFGMPQTRHMEPHAQNATRPYLVVGHFGYDAEIDRLKRDKELLMAEVVNLRQEQQRTKVVMEDRLQSSELRQQQMMAFLARIMQNPEFMKQLISQHEMRKELQDAISKKRRHNIDQRPEVDDLGAGSSLEQGPPVLFNSQDFKFLVDGIPTDFESPSFNGQDVIQQRDIDIGSTSEQQQNMPHEDLNDNIWEKLLNGGLGEENGGPFTEDDMNTSEKMGYLNSDGPTSSN